MKLVVVIPALNEEKTIGEVIAQIPRRIEGVSEIETVVVDDGSTDQTGLVAQKNGALVFRHPINLGVGAATTTGLKAARRLGAGAAVTLDGDGQHNPAEIPLLIQPLLQNKADLVIGSRFLNSSTQIPLLKKIGNHFFNHFTAFLYGVRSSDTQSGFKAFSKNALIFLEPKTHGYEICSEILAEATDHHLRIKEVPISVIYNHYTKTKGQSPLNGINILLKLILRNLV
ncbi:glycosyltransferase family 2 protein [Candidatus Berkelbacteria bacterium]|nr:glycosyltransferase family 2 protein [Candidatus Berkelbacteria bacterium]